MKTGKIEKNVEIPIATSKEKYPRVQIKDEKFTKFQKHISDEMVDLFKKKPFQGQSPENARIIFLSSDANYSPEISKHQFFKYILEYQKDGISFWKRYGCHHPFLLPDYPFDKNTAGVPFHRNFSKLGLGPEHAEHISFLELLDIPTIGNKSQDKDLYFNLISLKHLKYIEDLMLSGGNKLFFVSSGVLQDIYKLKKDYNVFSWLNTTSGHISNFSKSINGNKIKQIYHFSSSQIHSQLDEIRDDIDQWLIIKESSL